MEWIIPLVLATALVAPGVSSLLRERAGATLALVPAGVAIHALHAQNAVARGEYAVGRTAWVPSLGIEWAFRVDGLANLFVLLIAGIGALVVLYASGYLRGHPRLGRFYAFLFLFMGAMLGVATSDDLIVLFVFWELTTIASFLLIGFQHDRALARDAARRSLLVTGDRRAGPAGGLRSARERGRNDLDLRADPCVQQGDAIRRPRALRAWIVVTRARSARSRSPPRCRSTSGFPNAMAGAHAGERLPALRRPW